MKKLIVIFSIMALAACNGNGASDVSDSTVVDTVVVDTVGVVSDSLLKVDSVELGGPHGSTLEQK